MFGRNAQASATESRTQQLKFPQPVFSNVQEDATWVSIIALMAGVLMCAIAPIVFLMMVCCETSARGKIDQLCHLECMSRFGSFRKFGVPYFGVLTIRILLLRVLF